GTNLESRLSSPHAHDSVVPVLCPGRALHPDHGGGGAASQSLACQSHQRIIDFGGNFPRHGPLAAKESTLGKSRIVSVVAWQDQGISLDLVGWDHPALSGPRHGRPGGD